MPEFANLRSELIRMDARQLCRQGNSETNKLLISEGWGGLRRRLQETKVRLRRHVLTGRIPIDDLLVACRRSLTCPQGSFVPKGDHGIHAHRAARGNVARRGRDQCKQECDARKCQRIVSANAKYKTLQEARQEKPAGNANQYPDERES